MPIAAPLPSLRQDRCRPAARRAASRSVQVPASRCRPARQGRVRPPASPMLCPVRPCFPLHPTSISYAGLPDIPHRAAKGCATGARR
jgi:hypothetical protein